MRIMNLMEKSLSANLCADGNELKKKGCKTVFVLHPLCYSVTITLTCLLMCSAVMGNCHLLYFDGLCTVRYLASFDVHGVVIFVYEVGNFHEFVTLFFECLNECVECISSIFCAVVTENNRAVSEVFVICHGINNGIDPIILPVERIHIPLNCIVAKRSGGLNDFV